MFEGKLAEWCRIGKLQVGKVPVEDLPIARRQIDGTALGKEKDNFKHTSLQSALLFPSPPNPSTLPPSHPPTLSTLSTPSHSLPLSPPSHSLHSLHSLPLSPLPPDSRKFHILSFIQSVLHFLLLLTELIIAPEQLHQLLLRRLQYKLAISLTVGACGSVCQQS